MSISGWELPKPLFFAAEQAGAETKPQATQAGEQAISQESIYKQRLNEAIAREQAKNNASEHVEAGVVTSERTYAGVIAAEQAGAEAEPQAIHTSTGEMLKLYPATAEAQRAAFQVRPKKVRADYALDKLPVGKCYALHVDTTNVKSLKNCVNSRNKRADKLFSVVVYPSGSIEVARIK